MAIPWQFREPIAYAVGFAALVLGSRQFLDAQHHSRLLEVGATSLTRSAQKLEEQIDLVNDRASGILGHTHTIIDALGTIQAETLKLESAIDNVNRAVHTIPPGAFVEQFCARVTNIYNHWLPTLRDLGDKPEGALIELIQRLLHAVARLALEYDLRKVRYAANIMLFIPRAENGISFDGVSPDLVRQFLPPPLGAQHFEGILLLIDDLAVAAHPDDVPNEIHNDDKIEPVIFGVPALKECRQGKRWMVLPGVTCPHDFRQT